MDTDQPGPLAGLKFMRTLWVCNVSGGPFEYVGTRPGATQLAWKKRIATSDRPRGIRRGRGRAGADARLVRRSRSARRKRRSPPSRRTRARSPRAFSSPPAAEPAWRGHWAESNGRSILRCVSYVGREVFQTKIDCSCGAAVTIAELREHLVRRHCNVEGCSERALRTVSFGFRDPRFRIIGVPMGICRRTSTRSARVGCT